MRKKEQKNPTKKVNTEHVSCVDDFCGTVHFPKQRAVVLQEGEEGSKWDSYSQSVAEPCYPVWQQDSNSHKICVGWVLLRLLATEWFQDGNSAVMEQLLGIWKQLRGVRPLISAECFDSLSSASWIPVSDGRCLGCHKPNCSSWSSVPLPELIRHSHLSNAITVAWD